MVSVALIVVGGTNHSPVHFGLPRVAKNFLDLRLALYRVQLALVVMGLVEENSEQRESLNLKT